MALARPTVVQDLQLGLSAQASERGWNRGEVRLPRIIAGPDASTELAAMDCDVVLNGITGSAGLLPTLATLHAGTTLALPLLDAMVPASTAVTVPSNSMGSSLLAADAAGFDRWDWEASSLRSAGGCWGGWGGIGRR